MSGSNHPSEAQLLAYLDGETGFPPDTLTHLERCPTCRQLLEDLRTIGALVSASRDNDLPCPLWPAVEARCSRPKRPFFSPVFAIGSAAALVAGVLVGLWTGADNSPAQSARAVTAEQSAAQTLWSAVGSTLAVEEETSWPYAVDGDETQEGH